MGVISVRFQKNEVVMNTGLKGKVALVTGGSKGIGFAIAKALAAEGCHLRLAARDLVSLNAARDTIKSNYAVDVKVQSANLSEPGVADTLAADFPETDILINSAGAIARGSLLNIDPAGFREGFEGKVMASMMLCRALYPHMMSRKYGVIVNVIGIAGEKLNPNSIGTSVANAALIAFTKAFGAESVDHGVRVIGINPGLIHTGRTDNLLHPKTEVDRLAYAKVMANLPYGRMGKPEEVASLAVFLASDAAKYISGDVISVDAGTRFRA
jgi:NAD(P)-dependent dehydrogenase (short-subunit alcohol dehydrogenase family)